MSAVSPDITPASIDAPSMRHAGRELLSLALMDARNHTLHLLAHFEQAMRAGKLGGAASAPSWSCRSGWPAISAGWRNTGSAATRNAPWGPPVPPTACGWPRSSPWPTAGSTRRWRPMPCAGSWTCRTSRRSAPTCSTRWKARWNCWTRPPTTDEALYFLPGRAVPRGPAMRAAGHAGADAGPAAEAGAARGHPGAATPCWCRRGAGCWARSPAASCSTSSKWAHEVDVPEFEIDAQPVNWGQFVEFVDDGGYDQPEFWLPAGLGMAGARGRTGRPPRPALRGADRRGQRRGDADAFRQAPPAWPPARAPCT